MNPNNPLSEREKALENQYIREKEYVMYFPPCCYEVFE